MKYLQNLAIALLLAGCGYFLGMSRSEEELVPQQIARVQEQIELSKKYVQVRQKFKSLLENEVTAYYELKDKEQQFRQVNLVLAKIVEIFLADLGLKLQISEEKRRLVLLQSQIERDQDSLRLEENRTDVVEQEPINNESSGFKVREVASLPGLSGTSELKDLFFDLKQGNSTQRIEDLLNKTPRYKGQIVFDSISRSPLSVTIASSRYVRSNAEKPGSIYITGLGVRLYRHRFEDLVKKGRLKTKDSSPAPSFVVYPFPEGHMEGNSFWGDDFLQIFVPSDGAYLVGYYYVPDRAKGHKVVGRVFMTRTD